MHRTVLPLVPVFGLAILLTLVSVVYVRPVAMAEYGYVIEPIMEAQEGGGLPFAFLVDRPGVSIVHSIGPEDRFRPGWFWLDVACFFILLWAARRGLRTRRDTAPSLTFGRNRFLTGTALVFVGLCAATLLYHHVMSAHVPLFIGIALFWAQVPSFALAASVEPVMRFTGPWIPLLLAHLVVALLVGTAVGLRKREPDTED